jgi:hypothetical protein
MIFKVDVKEGSLSLTQILSTDKVMEVLNIQLEGRRNQC